MNNKKGLGKGLAALIGEAKLHFNTENLNADNELQYIKISDIVPNKDQPRKNFDPNSLIELAESIKENGILQPIMVQKIGESGYRIIAGERRWRASQIAGLEEVPVIIKSYNDSQELEIALIENIQRRDLNIMEEATAYLKLAEDFGYTQEKIAKSLGKSRSYIANILRLNSLPPLIQEKIANDEISMGHAKPLIGLENAEELVDTIIKKGLSVRQTEQLVKNYKQPQVSTKPINQNVKSSVPDPELRKLQEHLSEKLTTKVEFELDENGGKMVVFFKDIDELDEILTKIS